MTNRHRVPSFIGVPRERFRSSPDTAELSMTQRYMHLSPAALDSAIRLLDQPSGRAEFWRHFGDGEGLRRKDQWLEQLNWR